MTSGTVELNFCDLCSQSIPEADLTVGRAQRREGRLLCVACAAVATPMIEVVRTAPPVRAPSSGGRAALVLSMLAVIGVAVIAWQSTRDVRAMRAAVARVDPAQAAQVTRIQRQLDGIERRLERWFDDQWARKEAQRGTSTDATPLDLTEQTRRLDAALAGLDALGGDTEELRRSLERRLVAVEQRVEVASALVAQGPGEARAITRLDDIAPERRATLDRLRSSEPSTRARALIDLIARPSKADAPFATAMLRDDDGFVRVTAVRYLEDLRARASVGPLIERLSDTDATVRAAADSALRAITGQAFLFDPWGSPQVQSEGVQLWRDWWSESWKEFLFGEDRER